jgi:hypothetical protein
MNLEMEEKQFVARRELKAGENIDVLVNVLNRTSVKLKLSNQSQSAVQFC